MKVCTKWEKKNNHEDAIIEEDVFFFLEEMKETLVKPSRWVYLWADEPRNNFIPYHVHIQIQTKYEKNKWFIPDYYCGQVVYEAHMVYGVYNTQLKRQFFNVQVR